MYPNFEFVNTGELPDFYDDNDIPRFIYDGYEFSQRDTKALYRAINSCESRNQIARIKDFMRRLCDGVLNDDINFKYSYLSKEKSF